MSDESRIPASQIPVTVLAAKLDAAKKRLDTLYRIKTTIVKTTKKSLKLKEIESLQLMEYDRTRNGVYL